MPVSSSLAGVAPASRSRAARQARRSGWPRAGSSVRQGLGPNSHFYTTDAVECAKVKADPFWTYEGIAFNAQPPAAGDCFSDRIPVVRLYNNGTGGQANHRYTTSRSEGAAMQANGWIVEGPVFCGIP
jgi:hypothetical protein